VLSINFPVGFGRLATITTACLGLCCCAFAQSPADLNNDQVVDVDDWSLAQACVFGPDNGIPGLDSALLWDNMAGDRLEAVMVSEADFSANATTISFESIKRRTGSGKDYLFIGESTSGVEVFRLRWDNSGQVSLSVDGGSNEITVFQTGVNQSLLSSTLWNPAVPWTFEITLDGSGLDVTITDAASNSNSVQDVAVTSALLGKLVFSSATFGGTGGYWIDDVTISAAGLGNLFLDDFNGTPLGDSTISSLLLGISNGGIGTWNADLAEYEAADAAVVAASFGGPCQPYTFASLDYDSDADVDQDDVAVFYHEYTIANFVPVVDYYIDADGGNDNNTGLSPSQAWATLGRANLHNWQPGNRILLQAGDVFTGKLRLSGIDGTANGPIVIASYGSGPRPVIDAAGYFAGVELEDVNYIEVRDLEITADGGATVDGSDPSIRSGVNIAANTSGFSNITIDNLYIHDVYPEIDTEHEGTNPTTYLGFGVRARGANLDPHLIVQNCDIRRVGFKAIELNRVRYANILDNSMKDIGGPAMQPGRCEDLVFRGNVVDGSGQYVDPRMHGRGSGIWPWTCDRVLIEKNVFMHARGKGDSCGMHIDFNCNDVVCQYNFSMDNEGGFIEILGNNYNCAYRYNISVNDGARINGEGDNFQWGMTLFFSGYVGSGNPQSGPFNSYIYNNTIYVKGDQRSNFSFHETTDGVLIANNIFYIEGSSFDVTPDAQNDWTQDFIDGIVWTNNLYQRAGIIPAGFPFTDDAPVLGNPGFVCTGGLDPNCYIPLSPIVQDAGIPITAIPGDSIGLRIGLDVTEDFFGHPIIGLPDFGAIEFDPNRLIDPNDPNNSGDPNLPLTLIDEDFSTWADPVNTATPYPSNTWHMSSGSVWEAEDTNGSSVMFTTDSLALRTGWGYDEVVIRYFVLHSWDLTSDYTFTGKWEIENVLDVHLGLIVGFGEYDPSSGDLIRRIKETTIGEFSSPTIGQAGNFSLSLSSAELQTAGVSSANYIGIFLHHDDEGTLESDPWTDRNDVYLVDDILVTRSEPGIALSTNVSGRNSIEETEQRLDSTCTAELSTTDHKPQLDN
jgi:hypothetical protein